MMKDERSTRAVDCDENGSSACVGHAYGGDESYSCQHHHHKEEGNKRIKCIAMTIN